jgi:putative DNA primase/helicase
MSTDNIVWLDFNDAGEPVQGDRTAQREEIRTELLARLEAVLFTLFPAGKVRRGKFLIGDILGSPGESLEVVLEGDKAGLWTDRAASTGGDVFSLIGEHYRIDVRADFPRVLERSADLLGRSLLVPQRKAKRGQALDELGPATAKWDYQDASGNLIAVVYRYDPPGGRKEFRPWDAKRRKMAPPEPRPLYNQPGIQDADAVILVEGEKCAQALIEAGFVATTAMHGANAPVEKTDWSPLAGKAVLIWPDRDKPGFAYAEAASQAVLTTGAVSCAILLPPDDRPEGWDVADAVAEGFDVAAFVASGPRMSIQPLGGDEPRQEEEADERAHRSVWGSEDWLAIGFTRRYRRDWRYVALWGKWLVWDGQRWRTEDTLAASDLMRQICRHTATQAGSAKVAAKLAASSTISGVERLARSDRSHAATADEWDADIWLLNTPGGVADLRTGRLRPHERADRMTKIAAATPRGECPRWLAFIDQVTQGDRAYAEYLKRFCGYCLTGSTQEHALFFLYGTGANGKSVFVNTVYTLLGDYAANAPMDTFMETRGDRHPTDLAGLRGARLVGATETEQGRRWNESKIKEITGGDRVSARFMRQDFFTYVPQFKLVIAGNHKPAIRNIDEAMRRRLHLLPFTLTLTPDKRDQGLQEKLLAERDGILAWALQGCLAWQREGLRPPPCVTAATDEYFEAEDALGRWLEEACVLQPGACALTAALFGDWKKWAEAAGEFVGSQRRFSDLLLTRGLTKWRNAVGSRGFKGIGLKVTPADSFTPYADR